MTDRKIARLCTIDAIRRRNAETISAQKQTLASLASRIAHGAGEGIEDELAQGKIQGTALIPAFGVAVDKLMMISDQPTTTVQVNIHSVPVIYSEFRAVQDQIKVILAQALPTAILDLPDCSVEPVDPSVQAAAIP